jgi:hypothetical protein
VFATLLERAAALCGAERGTIFLVDGDVLRRHALLNAPDLPPAALRSFEALPLTRELLGGRAVLEGRTIAFAGARAGYRREYPATVVLPDRPPVKTGAGRRRRRSSGSGDARQFARARPWWPGRRWRRGLGRA